MLFQVECSDDDDGYEECHDIANPSVAINLKSSIPAAMDHVSSPVATGCSSVGPIGVASGTAGPVLAGPLFGPDHTHNHFHALRMLRIY